MTTLNPKKVTELSKAVELLKKNVGKSSTELVKSVIKPESNFSLLKENVVVGEKTWTVRRLCVALGDGSHFGWVINEDAKCCMECAANFGFSKWYHHCRKCGNIVCHPCSHRGKEVDSMEGLGEVRVCSRCYFKEHNGSMRGSISGTSEFVDSAETTTASPVEESGKCEYA